MPKEIQDVRQFLSLMKGSEQAGKEQTQGAAKMST